MEKIKVLIMNKYEESSNLINIDLTGIDKLLELGNILNTGKD